MTIIAPFDGVISAVGAARPGDLIGPNWPLAKIISASRTVEAKISEENFADLRIGQRASVRFLPYGAALFEANIVKILPTSDPETQRYIVHLDVKIAPDQLVPGITGEVSIVVGERMAKANVPRRALFGNNLYVVKDGRVELRQVEVGFTSLTTVEVLNGVAEGDEVIIDEIDRFRNGDRVRARLAASR
jgi:RND family efflux transporter MFP subunit